MKPELRMCVPLESRESAQLLSRRWREARRRFREESSAWETEWRRTAARAQTNTRRATGR